MPYWHAPYSNANTEQSKGRRVATTVGQAVRTYSILQNLEKVHFVVTVTQFVLGGVTDCLLFLMNPKLDIWHNCFLRVTLS